MPEPAAGLTTPRRRKTKGSSDPVWQVLRRIDAKDDPEWSQRPCPMLAAVEKECCQTLQDARCSSPDRQRETCACLLLKVQLTDRQQASAAEAMFCLAALRQQEASRATRALRAEQLPLASELPDSARWPIALSAP